MPDVFVLQSSENNQNRQSSPMNNDRYTPSPMNNDRYTPSSNENNQQPFRSSSPPIKTSEARPEFYHLKAPHDRPLSMLTSLDEPQPSSPTNLNDHRSTTPTFPGNNRVSPLPRSNLKKQGPEMYHLVSMDDPQQETQPIKTTRFSNEATRYDDDDSTYQPGKVTVFTISSAKGEKHPPTSPPIRPMKGKQQQQPFAYDIVNDENEHPISKPTAPNKHRALPIILQNAGDNIRYIPLEQSKASVSIARSMNKYRFAGY